MKVFPMLARHLVAIVAVCGFCFAGLRISFSEAPQLVATSPSIDSQNQGRQAPSAAVVTVTTHYVYVLVYWTAEVEAHWGGNQLLISALVDLERRMNSALSDAMTPRGFPTQPYDILQVSFAYDPSGGSKVSLPLGPFPLYQLGDYYYNIPQTLDMIFEPNDGVLDHFHWTREMTGKDYVVLLKMPAPGDSWGQSSGIKEGPSDPDYGKCAFAAVTARKEDWGWNGMNFSGSHRFTMAHELCHLMGLDHQRGKDGWTNYSYGHTYQKNGLLYGTLEATDDLDPGLIREMKLSDARPDNFGMPSLYGIPDQADSARHLREYFQPITNIRPDVAPSNTVLQIISPQSVTSKVGSPLTYQIAVNLPPGTPVDWQGLRWPLPEGLTFDPLTGTISGIPTGEIDSNYPIGVRWGTYTAFINLNIKISSNNAGCLATRVLALRKSLKSARQILPALGSLEKLDRLRQFRDEILKSTPEGQALVNAYYRLSPALIEWSQQDPQRLDQCAQLLEDLVPVVLQTDPLNTRQIQIPSPVAQRGLTFLQHISESTEGELHRFARSAEKVLSTSMEQNRTTDAVTLELAEFAAVIDAKN